LDGAVGESLGLAILSKVGGVLEAVNEPLDLLPVVVRVSETVDDVDLVVEGIDKL
jgi:hypothetical protein